MHKKEEFSISTFAMINKPLEEAIDYLIKTGWKNIELMCEDDHRVLLSYVDVELKQLKEKGKCHGVNWTIHAPIYTINPCSSDLNIQKASKIILHQVMDIAEYLECNYVVLHAGMEEGPTDGIEVLERCVSFFSAILAERQTNSPLKLLLENVAPKKNLHGVSPKFVRNVVELVNDSRIGILYDAGHAHVLGAGACLSGLEVCLPYLSGMHLNDNLGDYDTHLAIGMGTVPYSELIVMVQEYGFIGNWVIETETVSYAELSVDCLIQMHHKL